MGKIAENVLGTKWVKMVFREGRIARNAFELNWVKIGVLRGWIGRQAKKGKEKGKNCPN
jgi:hypothetical protein